MKRILSCNHRPVTLVLIAMLCCIAPAKGQTAEELIAKNIAAKGGMANIKAITSLRMTGKLEVQGIVIQIGADQKPDFLFRQTATVQGMTQIQAYDGSEGWQINPFSGRRDPERMGEDDTRDLVETSDFYGPLVDYQQKGSKVEYIGHASVDGDDALLLKVTLKNGDVINYFLDPDTYLEIRTERLMFVREASAKRTTILDLTRRSTASTSRSRANRERSAIQAARQRSPSPRLRQTSRYPIPNSRCRRHPRRLPRSPSREQRSETDRRVIFYRARVRLTLDAFHCPLLHFQR